MLFYIRDQVVYSYSKYIFILSILRIRVNYTDFLKISNQDHSADLYNSPS